ncbi:MAG: methionyl-tRNA formyltransferase [Acidimicrobiia bacterium]
MSGRARVVFFGSPTCAVPSLRALCEWGADIVYVVTQPARGRKRGRRDIPTPVACEAASRGIRVLSPSKVNQILPQIQESRSDAGVIVAYGQIIPKEMIEIFRNGILNLHFSLLPRWRGAAPVQRAILAGDTTTGVCTMLIDEGLDTGPVLECEATQIEPRERAGELEARLAEIGARLVIRSLEAILEGTARPKPQPADGVTYAPPLKREECQIDWSKSAFDIERLVRAAHPSPCAFTYLRGKLIKIHRAFAISEASLPEWGRRPGKSPGDVVVDENGQLRVVCGDGILVLEEVQPEGKRVMLAGEFLRGVRMSNTIRLGTS